MDNLTRKSITLLEQLQFEEWEEFLFTHEETEKPIEVNNENSVKEKLEIIKEKLFSYYDENMTTAQREGFSQAVIMASELIDNLLWDLQNGVK